MRARHAISTMLLLSSIAPGCNDDDARAPDPDAVTQAERAATQLHDAHAGAVHDAAARSAGDGGAPAGQHNGRPGTNADAAASPPMQGMDDEMPAAGGMGMDDAMPPAGGGMGMDGMGGAMPPTNSGGSMGGMDGAMPPGGGGMGMDDAMPPTTAPGSGGSMGMMAMMGMCCGGGGTGGSAAPMPGMASGAAPGMTRAMGMGGKAIGKKGGALQGFPGAPHLYHVGAVDFFLDRAAELRLTPEQSTELQRRKADAIEASAAADARIVAIEQRLWALTGSDRPQLAKITEAIGEVERLRASQRVALVRAVGEAAVLLDDAQRACVSGWADATTGLIEPATPAPSTCPGVGS